MGFKADLEFGQQYEIKLLNYITYSTYQISTGKFKHYDLLIDNTIKYEVKADRMAKKTGNICIEYECNNKPSGITTTESNYYAYFIEGIGDDEPILYIIPTDIIRHEIKNKTYKRECKGGNGYRAKLYLFKLECFNNYIV